MAKEAGTFTLEDVISGISEKLIRRHPHVFGDAQADGSEAVLLQWDEIKKQEKELLKEVLNPNSEGDFSGVAPPASALDGVPRSLGALLKAAKLQKKASKIGFDWPHWQGTLEKLQEEMQEVSEEAERTPRDLNALEEEVGDLLFSAVNVARALKVDPEQALGKANVKFRTRFQSMEAALLNDGKDPETVGIDALETYWQAAKAQEKQR
jgi:MazG family protein